MDIRTWYKQMTTAFPVSTHWTWYKQMLAAFPEWRVEHHSGNNFVLVKDFEIAYGDRVLIGIAEDSVFSLLHPSGDPMTVDEYVEYQAKEDEWLQKDDCCQPLLCRYDDGEILATSSGETWIDPPILECLTEMLNQFLEVYFGLGSSKEAQMRCIDVEDVEGALELGRLYTTRNNDGQLLDALCKNGWQTFVVERFEPVN